MSDHFGQLVGAVEESELPEVFVPCEEPDLSASLASFCSFPCSFP
ncbi:hypothetical protein ACFP1Z_27250 [Streptomyces gamaensis]|uniref:Uncharacterized protein n=1 Tax=Streptomyces gamaensis TaxID=1763542 RepID=A0ABW0Z601_9ACTN